MARIAEGVLKDFLEGEYVHADDLDQIFAILRVAINDNYDKIVDRYTKTETTNLLSTKADKSEILAKSLLYDKNEIDSMISSGNELSEVSQARIGSDGIVYDVLKQRLDKGDLKEMFPYSYAIEFGGGLTVGNIVITRTNIVLGSTIILG